MQLSTSPGGTVTLTGDNAPRAAVERPSSPGPVTVVLNQVRTGQTGAEAELLQLVYQELRRLAAGQLRRERWNHTLQATALVHETYLRLFGRQGGDWHDRSHFFGAAAHVMRNILVDHARTIRAQKRGGGMVPVELKDFIAAVDHRADEILSVDAALEKLDQLSKRQRTIVEMKFYAGFTEEEIAEMLCVSVRTIKREWALARAWLHSEMCNSKAPSNN